MTGLHLNISDGSCSWAVSGLHGLERRYLAYAPPAVSRIDSFGWQASEVTLPATVFFVIGAVTSPPAGWRSIDSSRAIIGLGSTLLPLNGLFRHQQFWQLVAVYALLGLALSLCGLVSNMVMLTGWFDLGRGATGILLMASSSAARCFPSLSDQASSSWAGDRPCY